MKLLRNKFDLYFESYKVNKQVAKKKDAILLKETYICRMSVCMYVCTYICIGHI